MKSPDFICIGAQKAGTTWLYNNLKDHPDIILPHLKELHFFDEIHRKVKRNLFCRLFNNHWMNAWWRYNLKHRFYHSLKELNAKKFYWLLIYFFYTRNFNWYRRLFSNKKNKITGELTPDYSIINKKLIGQIYKEFPTVKILLLLRDPVEVDWSHIKMIYLRTQNLNSLDTIPKNEIIKFLQKPNPYADYPVIIQNWLSVFPKKQVFIGFYDDIVHNPTILLENIYTFLGIRILDINRKSHNIYNKGIRDSLSDEYKSILFKKHKCNLDYLEKYFDSHEKNYPALWKEKYS